MDDLTVEYALAPAPGEDPEEKARGLALEQTAELPPTALPEGIDEVWTGRVEAVEPMGEGRYLARIAYRADLAGGELPQLLNLLFGNISLKGGIRVVEVHWPPRLLESLGGPRHGIEGIRAMAGAPEGPLTCTALKPVGSSSVELARLAGELAQGGMHVVKDDHGLVDQAPAPFHERVQRCLAAVEEGGRAAGRSALYAPHVTGPRERMTERLEAAGAAGCRAVLVSPWLVGLDALQWARDRFGLALLAHPALTGAYFTDRHGVDAPVLLGHLFRAAGADAVIYPNVGGRFAFTEETCLRINAHLREPLGDLRPALPTPAGGMRVTEAPGWVERYGDDVMVLIGGDLHREGDPRRAAARLREALASRHQCTGHTRFDHA